MKFFRVSTGGDHFIQVIVAHSEYEAVGYYLMSVLNEPGYIEDILCEELAADHPVEVSCVGFPVYKTLAELLREKDSFDIQMPSVVCGLLE